MYEDDVAVATTLVASIGLGAEDGCAKANEDEEAGTLAAATEEPAPFR
jgi:hypothetical protein